MPASNSGKVRIIGGQWKRTNIPVLNADGLRPTGDRQRETLFEHLPHAALQLGQRDVLRSDHRLLQLLLRKGYVDLADGIAGDVVGVVVEDDPFGRDLEILGRGDRFG